MSHYEKKLCEICDSYYFPNSSAQKICVDCRTRDCAHCGRSFTTRNGKNKQIYCGKSCSVTALNTRPEVKERRIKSVKKANARSEVKRRLSEASNRPEVKERRKKAMAKPEYRKHRSELAIRQMQQRLERDGFIMMPFVSASELPIASTIKTRFGDGFVKDDPQYQIGGRYPDIHIPHLSFIVEVEHGRTSESWFKVRNARLSIYQDQFLLWIIKHRPRKGFVMDAAVIHDELMLWCDYVEQTRPQGYGIIFYDYAAKMHADTYINGFSRKFQRHTLGGNRYS